MNKYLSQTLTPPLIVVIDSDELMDESIRRQTYVDLYARIGKPFVHDLSNTQDKRNHNSAGDHDQDDASLNTFLNTFLDVFLALRAAFLTPIIVENLVASDFGELAVDDGKI